MSRNHDHATYGFCLTQGMRPPSEAQPATARVEVTITVDAMVVNPTNTGSVMSALGDFTNVSMDDREPGVIGWKLEGVEVITGADLTEREVQAATDDPGDRWGGKELKPWLRIAKQHGATVETGRHLKVRNADGELVMTLPLGGSERLGRSNNHTLRKRWKAQGWPTP